MRRLKFVCFTLNVVWLIAFSFVVSMSLDKIEKWEWQGWLMASTGIIVPLLSCYYFMNTGNPEPKDDSLVGLWLKVKKKKLKDQLK